MGVDYQGFRQITQQMSEATKRLSGQSEQLARYEEWLDHIVLGGVDETVNVKGIDKPTMAKIAAGLMAANDTYIDLQTGLNHTAEAGFFWVVDGQDDDGYFTELAMYQVYAGEPVKKLVMPSFWLLQKIKEQFEDELRQLVTGDSDTRVSIGGKDVPSVAKRVKDALVLNTARYGTQVLVPGTTTIDLTTLDGDQEMTYHDGMVVILKPSNTEGLPIDGAAAVVPHNQISGDQGGTTITLKNITWTDNVLAEVWFWDGAGSNPADIDVNGTKLIDWLVRGYGEWPQKSMVLENDLNVKDSGFRTISDITRACQGLTVAYYGGEVCAFVLMPKTPNYKPSDDSRIVKFVISSDGKVSEAGSYTQALNIGHQGLGSREIDGELYVYFSMGVTRTDTSSSSYSGKGISRAKWSGHNTVQDDVESFRLFDDPDTSKASWHKDNHQFAPTISTDGNYIVGVYRYNGTNRIAVYNHDAVIAKGSDATALKPISDFQVQPEFDSYYQSGQGVACDGKFIYVLTGNLRFRKQALITKYTLYGELIANIPFSGLSSYYGWDSVVNSDPDLGFPHRSEEEGIALYNGRIYIVSTDQWYKSDDVPVVSFNGNNYYAYKSGRGTNANYPGIATDEPDWLYTQLDAKQGEFEKGKDYGWDKKLFSRQGYMLYSMRDTSDLNDNSVTFPVIDISQEQSSNAALNVPENYYPIANIYGEDFSIGGWSTEDNTVHDYFNYTIEDSYSAFQMYDARPNANQNGFANIMVQSSEVSEEFSMRYKGIRYGAALTLFGNNDSNNGASVFYNNGVRSMDITRSGDFRFYDCSDDSKGTDQFSSIWMGHDGKNEHMRLMYGSDRTKGGCIYIYGNDDPSNNGGITFYAGDQEVLALNNGATFAVRPGQDASQNLGTSGHRWASVYASSDAISTSDAREKTDVVAMSDDEIAASKALASKIGFYQFTASVESNGSDKARKHAGLTVQTAIQVLKDNNLDPCDYAFICFDVWTVSTDSEGNENATEVIDRSTIETVYNNAVGGKETDGFQSRFSFRLGELNQFILRGLDARISALEGDE